MTATIQQIENTICNDFPEEAKRLQAGKPLTKTQEKAVQTYILGIMRGYILCGQEIPPYMYINYQCGRLDRLFKVKEA